MYDRVSEQADCVCAVNDFAICEVAVVAMLPLPDFVTTLEEEAVEDVDATA